MRELSLTEQADLSRRKAQFNSFLEERMPVLTDFVERLELPNAAMVVVQADSFLPAVSHFMQAQEIAVEDRTWIVTRIGYFVGEWLVQKYGGCWYLNETPETRYFLRYVVGQFARLRNQNTMVDPFFVAETFVDTPCPRSLVNVLADVDSELNGTDIGATRYRDLT